MSAVREIRVKLDFTLVDSLHYKFVWFLVNSIDHRLISDLRNAICSKYNLEIENVELYVEEALLPDESQISLLRENDVVRVLYNSSAIETIDLEQCYPDQEIITKNEKNSKKRKLSSIFESQCKKKQKKEKKREKHCSSDVTEEFTDKSQVDARNLSTVEKRSKTVIPEESQVIPRYSRTVEKLSKTVIPTDLEVISRSSPTEEKRSKSVIPEESQVIPKNSSNLEKRSKTKSRFISFRSLTAEKRPESVISEELQVIPKNSSNLEKLSKTVIPETSQVISCSSPTAEKRPESAIHDSERLIKILKEVERELGNSEIRKNSDECNQIHDDDDLDGEAILVDDHLDGEVIFVVDDDGVAMKKPKRKRHRKRKRKNSRNVTENVITDPKLTEEKLKPNEFDGIHLRFTEDSGGKSLNLSLDNSTPIRRQVALDVVDKAIEKIENNLVENKTQVLNAIPRIGSHIAFKMLELSELYCPEVSDLKEGKVVNVNSESSEIEVELLSKPADKQRSGKFENIYPTEEETIVEVSDKIIVNWNEMIEPKLVLS